jgi:hypothetical protein
MKLRRSSFVLPFAILFGTAVCPAQSTISPQPAAEVIIDTDIGDDIDDAFAVDLALTSPELHILDRSRSSPKGHPAMTGYRKHGGKLKAACKP